MSPDQLEERAKAYRLREEKLEEALLTGEDASILQGYFGGPLYAELRELAQETRGVSVRGGPRVLILPGIMGSKLGKPGLLVDDVLWFDPVEIVAGRLDRLALEEHPGHGHTNQYEAVGVILLAYLKLKWRLVMAGYDAHFYPFDWRQDIVDVGRELAEHLANGKARPVSLVAHSMGGLVARSAIAHGAPNIKRMIMLGTPNHGSFAPVQALRGTYPVVRKIAALDTQHDAKALAAEIFNTFPGLYQMLPWKSVFDALDLYNLENWPDNDPRPRDQLLKNAPVLQQGLAPADDRFVLIAGVNQETITGLRLEGDEFVYEYSAEGDGTVPLRFAQMPGLKTYYVEESHGSLPNNGDVERAVIDILDTGSTAVLPQEWTPSRRRQVRQFRDQELRAAAFDGRRGEALRDSEIRSILEELVAPGAAKSAPAEAESDSRPSGTPVEGYAHVFSRIVVGRKRQHRIDIRLAQGSITEVDSQAYVLGFFRDVEPSGAARALNSRLNGAITEFTARRMLSGGVGELFMMPTGRYPVTADLILFAGLGAFDHFTDEALQITAENIIRTFVRTRIDEFATVLLGAGSGCGIARSVENLLVGFFRGLKDTDTDYRFRGITVCETDRQRYVEMKQAIYRLSSTPLFEDVEVTLDELTLPPAVEPIGIPRYPVGEPDPFYLIVRLESESNQTLVFRSSVLTVGGKATVLTGFKELKKNELDAHLRTIESTRFTFPKLSEYGNRLAELVLFPDVAAVLHTMKGRHLVVVHDAPSSRIPWETLGVKDWFPAMEAGLSRRYVADNLSVAKWLEQRRYGNVLDLLLVVNPTRDLDGAEEEGNRIAQLFASHPGVQVHELRGAQATRKALAAAFKSGQYDVLHYAGHAFFDATHPARSGIVCHGDEPLRGSELAGLGELPALVFFNACEAGRVRRRDDSKAPGIAKRIEVSVGLAEAFLRGGVANYLGTYWPVGDVSAKKFAETFYLELLAGKSIGRALLSARQAVANIKSVDWADYIHYGSHNFVLKGAE